MQTVKHAKLNTGGGLGNPSKMPGTSYGLSAEVCKLGAILARQAGTTCHGCYAMGGNYQYSSVKVAHARRLASLSNPGWVESMAFLIARAAKRSGVRYHRWHDSGDLQSLAHLQQIVAVARLTPSVRYWLPTRELATVKAWERVTPARLRPRNLVIRVSATRVDGTLPPRPATVSGVSALADSETYPTAVHCPAPTQGNACESCRRCWRRDVKAVVYHKH